MSYTGRVPFDGDTSRAFDVATAALTPAGFRVTHRDKEALTLSGPGLRSTKQAAILGASEIRISRDDGGLHIEADFAGVRWITWFLIVFPLALGLFLGLLFALMSYLTIGQVWFLPVVLIAGVNALLWLLMAPFLTRYVRNRSMAAVEALLINIASV